MFGFMIKLADRALHLLDGKDATKYFLFRLLQGITTKNI